MRDITNQLRRRLERLAQQQPDRHAVDWDLLPTNPDAWKASVECYVKYTGVQYPEPTPSPEEKLAELEKLAASRLSGFVQVEPPSPEDHPSQGERHD